MSTAIYAFLGDSVATLLINASFSVQKLGHREVEHTSTSKQAAGLQNRDHMKSITWWLGITMMVSGVTVHLIALPYADLALLSANSSLAIMINLILSIWLFKEKFIPKYDLTATILIISGAFSIVLLANKAP